MTDWSGLRARCQQWVDELLQHTGVPYPWDINQFLDRLDRHRGRDIDLCALAWRVGDSCGSSVIRRACTGQMKASPWTRTMDEVAGVVTWN